MTPHSVSAIRNIEVAAYKRLLLLNRAVSLQDLAAIRGNRLEKLSGDRDGQHSIRVNDRYRLCFRWKGSDAFDVELVDYRQEES